MTSPIDGVTDVVCTCPGMPNQFEGKVDGKPFYFRARWGCWRLHVNASGGEGWDGAVVAWGHEHKAGWWDEDEARAFMLRQLADYRAGVA